MAQITGISWCDSTANLWIGCSKVSGACDHCYAEDLMGTEGSRLKRVPWGPDGDRVHCKQGWKDLRRWQRLAERHGGIDPELGRQRIVFINSLSDFFDNHRSVIWRPEAWALFRECTHLIIILVTKRPQLIGRELPEFWDEIAGRVWLLTTVEDQQWADIRIPQLLASTAGRAMAGCYGISFEPMLGDMDVTPYLWGRPDPCDDCPRDADCACGYRPRIELGVPAIGWGIIGGESGKHARSMPADEGRGLIGQLKAASVPVHFKQRSEADHPASFKDAASFPADLQIREMPR